jgi:uncharacterized membrane protein YagU involved in acid resistance
MSHAGKKLLPAIVVAGIVTGTLDIVAAFASAYWQNQTSPAAVLRFVASGIFGTDAFSGGLLMAFTGLALHFTIAFGWSVIYFQLYKLLPSLGRRVVVAGIGYGLLVWLIMNQVVLPMSNTPKFPFDLTGAIRGAIILILMIGLPNAVLAHRFYIKK